MSKEKRKRFGSDWAELVYDGFMKIWRIVGFNWEIVEKKDAVGLFVYNRDRRQALFVKQYRPAVGHSIVEIIAGHIETRPKDMDPVFWVKCTMAREALEEAGANIDPGRIELMFNGGIYTSPGFTTEKLWLGYVEIGDEDIEDKERIFGLQEEGERIQRIWVDVDKLGDHLDDGALYDMKTIAQVEWFLREYYQPAATQYHSDRSGGR